MTQPAHKGALLSASEWPASAESDLNAARHCRGQADVAPELVCFHAQQCAEKALKAVMIRQSIQFPFTHDIDGLLDVLQAAGAAVPKRVDDAGALTPYAVQTRYPGYHPPIDEAEVGDALELAFDVLEWARATCGG